MEQKLTLKTPDDHLIYGMLNWQEPRPKRLIVFVHGLGGDMHRHLHFNAARFFPQHDFATFRFNLYDFAEKGRLLHECSLQTHADDISIVLEHFSPEFDELFLVGHSLAGPAIIKSSQAVKAAVLWDPSLVLDTHNQKYWELNADLNYPVPRAQGVRS